jgi:FlgD Ig-like domain
MPRASFSVCALLTVWLVLIAAQPTPVGWNLASSDHVFRLVRVLPGADKAPEANLDWPATRSRIQLADGRAAWVWEVDRNAIPVANHYKMEGLPFKAPLNDVVCFGCTQQDEPAIDAVIGPRTADQDPDTLHPYSPITLVISDATAYPNPFNPFTDDATISVTLTDDADMNITAYDWDGKSVATVFKGPWIIGVNQTLWSGQTQDGRKLGNGVYFLRVVAKSGTRQEEQIIKVAVWNER